MCRHLAYLGPATTLRSVIIDPPDGLYRQAWAPRWQRHGTVNADGFGVGWYAPGDPDPARYRRAEPIWGDESFADVARVTRSSAVLAAVRCATADTVRALRAAGVTGRFNFLLTDGQVIAATAAGDTLWHRLFGPAVVVASEPSDDEPGWTEVPDHSAVAATARCVRVTGLTSDERIAIP